MEAKYTFKNGTSLQIDYKNSTLKIDADDDLAFRHVNGEDRIVAIDLNTGKTTNEYINSNSKQEPNLEKLNKIRKEQGLRPLSKTTFDKNNGKTTRVRNTRAKTGNNVKKEQAGNVVNETNNKVKTTQTRMPSKSVWERKLAKLKNVQQQRDELKKQYDELTKKRDEATHSLTNINKTVSTMTKAQFRKLSNEAAKNYEKADKEMKQAMNKLRAFDIKHPTLSKDIENCENKIKEINQMEYDKKHPKLTEEYLQKVGQVKFTKDAVARAKETVANTVKSALDRVLERYSREQGGFVDAYDKREILKAAKTELEKHNKEMTKMLGSKYQAKVKTIIKELDKGIAENEKLIKSFEKIWDKHAKDIRKKYRDYEDEGYESDEEATESRRQKLSEDYYKASKWYIPIYQWEIEAMKNGRWNKALEIDTEEPPHWSTRTYPVSGRPPDYLSWSAPPTNLHWHN